LEEPHPDLAGHTVGHGPGGRFALLNRLGAEVDPREWLVIADDDCRIAWPWTLATFVTVCARIGFDLAQPAHTPTSHHWTAFNEQHPSVMARETTYVETGPMIAVSPRLRPRIMPFPEDTEMGWGTDVLWNEYVAEGYRLGIVDGVPLEHLAPGGALYDNGPENERANRLLAERGYTYMGELMHEVSRFRWVPFGNDGAVMEPGSGARRAPTQP
jgi:hypothetical protein